MEWGREDEPVRLTRTQWTDAGTVGGARGSADTVTQLRLPRGPGGDGSLQPRAQQPRPRARWRVGRAPEAP